MALNVDDFTLIEGGRATPEGKEHTSSNAARSAGGLLITTSHKNPSGIGLSWPHVLGVLPCGPDTLAIIGSFCLVTLYGSGVASLARAILDRRISELHEGSKFNGGRIERVAIEGNLPKLGNPA